jgi:hypothetical protein
MRKRILREPVNVTARLSHLICEIDSGYNKNIL